MMTKTFLWAASPMAGLLVAAAPAQAQQATITVTGNILNGYDATGTFGAVGASLAGLPFSAIFTVLPQAGNAVVNSQNLSYLAGAGATSPVTAALTIGSGTYAFGGTLNSSARAVNGAGPGQVGSDALEYFSHDADFTASPATNAFLYVRMDSLRDLLNKADFSSYSTINLTASDNATGKVQIANPTAFAPSTFADLSVTTISASVNSAVPEPATWMMMIAGFGVAGAALRRQRAKATIRFA